MQEGSPNRVRWVSQADMLLASAHFDEVSQRLNPPVDRAIRLLPQRLELWPIHPSKC